MNKNIQVLLAEDEETLAMIIKDTLEDQGFDISVVNNGADGLQLYHDKKPNIIVADIMMPIMDGFEMVRRIRLVDKQTPVLFLTARSAVKDVVEGFEIGANDYLKKPFGMQELIIRIKALVGRIAIVEKEQTTFGIGTYDFDPIAQKLLNKGVVIELSHREAEILKRLCANKNNVVNTQDILLDLWGDDSFFNGRSLHVFITKLRHKLSKDENIKIINVRGVGYKLIIQ